MVVFNAETIDVLLYHLRKWRSLGPGYMVSLSQMYEVFVQWDLVLNVICHLFHLLNHRKTLTQ